MANYKTERDAVLRRWYGEISRTGRRKRTSWPNPIGSDDYVGIPTPVNAPFAFLLHGDCLVWLHALDSGGYGKLTVDGERVLAHRVAYAQAIREISPDQQINHLCDRPYCVQPAHLYAGDQQDNADDAHLFALNTMLSPVDRILLAPNAEYQDPLLKRLRASGRFGFVQPWESHEPQGQTSLDEFECPEHDFRIPAGESARVCRICERFEHEEESSSNFHMAAIGKEIYPVSQLIDSVRDKVVGLELGQDGWQGWREKCCYRGSVMVMGDDHVLRSAIIAPASAQAFPHEYPCENSPGDSACPISCITSTNCSFPLPSKNSSFRRARLNLIVGRAELRVQSASAKDRELWMNTGSTATPT